MNDSNPSILQEIYDVVLDRARHPDPGSYTNYLLDKGLDKIVKKFGEQAIQVIVAVPAGLVVGWALANALMAASDPEQFRFPAVISTQTYGFAALVVTGAAVATAALVRRRLDRLDLIDALKARD